LIIFIFKRKFEYFFAFQQYWKLLKFNNILCPFLFDFSIGTSIFLLQICWFRVHGIYLGSRLVVQELLYLGTFLVPFLDEGVYNKKFALKAFCS
jgi:hypothetical protein